MNRDKKNISQYFQGNLVLKHIALELFDNEFEYEKFKFFLCALEIISLSAYRKSLLDISH